MGLTGEIGEFVAGLRFERLPPDGVATVCLGFTDCVAVMVAGWDEPVRRVAAQTFGRRVSERSNRPLHGVDAATPDLALLYAVAAHALDYDDTALLGHPSAILVPAILAEANDIGADGQKMIVAYAAGYEVWAELIWRERNQHHEKGWHPTAMFGALASAASCGALRELLFPLRRHAVGNAVSSLSGPDGKLRCMTN